MSRLFCLIALVLVGLAGSDAAADEPDVAPTVDFEAILRRPVKVEFVDTPLSDVIDYFASKFDINIVVDSKGLADAAVDPSAPVTLSLRKPISFEAALRLVLESFDLTFVVRDEVLQITSKERANEILTTKVYDVGDLLDRGRLTGGTLADAIVFAASPDSWDDNGGPGQISRVGSTFVISQGRAAHAEVKELLGQLRAELNKGSSAAGSKRAKWRLSFIR